MRHTRSQLDSAYCPKDVMVHCPARGGSAGGGAEGGGGGGGKGGGGGLGGGTPYLYVVSCSARSVAVSPRSYMIHAFS